MHRVVIVGGGISGLSAAYFLEKYARESGVLQDLSIQLLERRDRLGGVILTERRDGFLLEGGPDSFLSQKPAAIELSRALGLGDELLPSNDRQRKTYILHDGKLKELPDGLMFMLPTKVWPILRSDLFSLAGKIRLGLAPLLSPPRMRTDVSVADFVSQRLGKQALERLAEPLISAVYGADVNSLSAATVLQRFIALEEKHGSLWQAVRQQQRTPAPAQHPASSIFVSLRDGVGRLAEAVEKSLVTTKIILGADVKKIIRGSADSGFVVRWNDGETVADALILATPAHAAGKLLDGFDIALTGKLSSIPYHSTVTVALAFEDGSFGRPLDGFGFVVPRVEHRRLLACTWVCTKFAFRCPPGRVLLRAFLGGARDPSVIEEDDSSILKIVFSELREIMGLRAEPLFTRIHRWEQSMPQYNVGHLQRLKELRTLLSAQPGLFLTGNAYKGVGIPDCIETSSQAAAAAVEYLRMLQPSTAG